MSMVRIAQAGRLRWSVPAVVAGLVAAGTLAGPAAAAAGLDARLAGAGPAAGMISTVAGGVGGPARATRVALSLFGVSFGAGHLYIATGGSVREGGPLPDRVATPPGAGAVGPAGDGSPA